MTASDLRAFRQRLGMTQAELAETFGISLSQFHNYERGSDRRTGVPCPVPRLVQLACEALSARVAHRAAPMPRDWSPQ